MSCLLFTSIKNRSEKQIEELPYFSVPLERTVYNPETSSQVKVTEAKVSLDITCLAETKYCFYIVATDDSSEVDSSGNNLRNKLAYEYKADLTRGNLYGSIGYEFNETGDFCISGNTDKKPYYRDYWDQENKEWRTSIFDKPQVSAINRSVFVDEESRYSDIKYYYPMVEQAAAKNLIVSGDSYTVIFDKPCLVQTLRNKTNYGTDIEAWENHTPEKDKINQMVLAPVLADTGNILNYSEFNGLVSRDGTDGVLPDNLYYCVIVHFADGTSLMGPVLQQ